MHKRTLILGAGAAGLHCAAHAGPDVLVVDHAKKPAEKVRISGGGRCNFTNTGTEPGNFLGENPHFHKSALSQYSQWDFVELVSRHGIAWHEKTLGQLFCDDSAKDIIAMLLAEAQDADIWLETDVGEISHNGKHFQVQLTRHGKDILTTADHLVVATGGKSIPKMGATGLAYGIAEHFGHRVTETRPALVPLTFPDGRFKALSGVSLPVRAACNGTHFDEAMLFTHRGLSGPAILQISSFWREGGDLGLDLLPQGGLVTALNSARSTHGKRQIGTLLAKHLPVRLVEFLGKDLNLTETLANATSKSLETLEAHLRNWTLVPQGSEGYRTAEVTLGGVATDRLSSKTMQSRDVPGLYFIGEAVDVTGWLGGYNFQWAWSSAFLAGRTIAQADQ